MITPVQAFSETFVLQSVELRSPKGLTGFNFLGTEFDSLEKNF